MVPSSDAQTQSVKSLQESQKCLSASRDGWEVSTGWGNRECFWGPTFSSTPSCSSHQSCPLLSRGHEPPWVAISCVLGFFQFSADRTAFKFTCLRTYVHTNASMVGGGLWLLTYTMCLRENSELAHRFQNTWDMLSEYFWYYNAAESCKILLKSAVCPVYGRKHCPFLFSSFDGKIYCVWGGRKQKTYPGNMIWEPIKPHLESHFISVNRKTKAQGFSELISLTLQ